MNRGEETTYGQSREGREREAVILMSDMVGYSRKTALMRPLEVCDYATRYHNTMISIVDVPEFQPVDIEILAGDGAICVFDKREGEGREDVCIRALRAALALSKAINEGRWAPTRMGLFLGDLVEARIGNKIMKFGASFSVATRLEELCDFFGTTLLMDYDVAMNQNTEAGYLVSVGRVSLKSFARPLQVFTIYKPGLHNIPDDVDFDELLEFNERKNKAMVHFSGISNDTAVPNFPKVRAELAEAQKLFRKITGKDDKSIERILEYIRENPMPEEGFIDSGMRLADKKRSTLGSRIFHLSSELLKAMNQEFYHALVVDTSWENQFHLEWRKKGDIIITINDEPDGVYFIDSGEVSTINEDGEEIAVLKAGTIFGEIAYFTGAGRRTATVQARTDVVMRKISGEDLKALPVIMSIFEQIANTRI